MIVENKTYACWLVVAELKKTMYVSNFQYSCGGVEGGYTTVTWI